MSTNRKLRSNAKFAKLTPEQYETFVSWFHEPATSLEAMQDRLQKQFGIDVTVAAISMHRQKHVQIEKYGLSSDFANVCRNMMPENADFGEASVNMMSQKIFEMLSGESVDLETLSVFGKFVDNSNKQKIKIQELELSRRRVALLEKKADALDRVNDAVKKVKTDGGLSPEALKIIEEAAKIL